MANKILTRRRTLQTLGVATLASLGNLARAGSAAMLTRPISFVIPFGPGGSFDSYGREFSELLTKSLNINVEPINQPGGGGTLAIFDLFQSPADGSAISLIDVPGIFLRETQLRKSVVDLTWVANLGRDAFGLAVGINSPVSSLAELKALSARRPISFATTGIDSAYVATKVFIASLGLRARFISGFKGSSDASVAARRGDVDAVVYSLSTILQMQKAGLLRPVFVFQEDSSIPGVEDARAVNQPDLGKFFAWRPVVAPPGLPEGITSTLSAAFVEAAKSSAAQDWAKKSQTTLHPLDHQATLNMIAEQTTLIAKWKADL